MEAKLTFGIALKIIFQHIPAPPAVLAERYVDRDRTLVYKWLRGTAFPPKRLFPDIIRFVMDSSGDPARGLIRNELDRCFLEAGLDAKLREMTGEEQCFENYLENVFNLLAAEKALEKNLLQPKTVNPPESQNQPELSPAARMSGRPWGKANRVMAGGLIVIAVVIAALLVPGWLRQDSPPVVTEDNDPSVMMQNVPASSVPSAQTQELTRNQQEILDTFAKKFPEILPRLAKEVMDDKVFLAAAEMASYTDPVFEVYGLDVTLLLPDPRAESLDKLGIAPYTQYSGARSYIRENYAKLCGMDTPDRIEIPVTLYYQTGIGGEQTLDWELSGVFWGLYEYLNVFTPHIEQYMADMGFYDAAVELLMPDIRSWESAAGSPACLEEYFADLAGALSFKGVDINGQLVVDSRKIETALKERLARVWVCDSVFIGIRHYLSPYRPHIELRSLAPVAFFSHVREGLDALYRSGSSVKPASQEDLESAFLSAAREAADGSLDSSAAKDQWLVTERQYAFDWETLGNDGIAACPELVEEMRSFLNSCDFHLMFLR